MTLLMVWAEFAAHSPSFTATIGPKLFLTRKANRRNSFNDCLLTFLVLEGNTSLSNTEDERSFLSHLSQRVHLQIALTLARRIIKTLNLLDFFMS